MTATVKAGSGQATPTGNVVFEFYSSGTWVADQTKALGSNGTASATVTAGIPSFIWQWRARYVGSSNTAGSTSAAKTIDVR
jgi:hypothetical protein